MAQELAALKQPSPKSRFGTAAPPRPTRCRCHFARNEKSILRGGNGWLVGEKARFLPAVEMTIPIKLRVRLSSYGP